MGYSNRREWWLGVEPPKFKGTCSEIGPELWFTSSRPLQKRAIELCNNCPSLETCKDYVVRNEVPYGIFAGMTRGDRQRYNEQWRELLSKPRGDAKV